jgi:hypothetical protein
MIHLCRFLGIGAIVAAIGWVGASYVESFAPRLVSHAPKEKVPEPKQFPPRMVDVGCTASRCHGNPVPADADKRLDETWKWSATVWAMSDRHQFAFTDLKNDKSKAIGKLLGIEPTESARCLVCHSDPALSNRPADPDVVQVRSQGIGCRACHGDPANWLEAHLNWGPTQDRKPEYEKHGMTWMNDLPSRAAMCVKCHVGTGKEGDLVARDVDHDLIAAGHPRLNFDFATYLRAMPPHWSEKDRRTHKPVPVDFAVEAWSVGRVAGMKASLDLLEYRSDPKSGHPWPEFTEFNCWDCHHDLNVKGRRVDAAGGKRGVFGWYRAAELELLTDKTPTDFLRAMQTPSPDKARVHSLVPGVKSSLKAPPDSPAALLEWLDKIEEKTKTPSWDEAAWVYNALGAVDVDCRLHGKNLTGVDEQFTTLRNILRLDAAGPGEPRWNSPRSYDPEPARKLLLDLTDRLRKSVDEK